MGHATRRQGPSVGVTSSEDAATTRATSSWRPRLPAAAAWGGRPGSSRPPPTEQRGLRRGRSPPAPHWGWRSCCPSTIGSEQQQEQHDDDDDVTHIQEGRRRRGRE